MADLHKLKLRKPINAHGELISEITLKEPTGADIIACGIPFKLKSGGGDGEIEISSKAIGQYIVRLADIPQSAVSQMAATDFMQVMNEVMAFFGEADETPAPSSQISPTSSISEPETLPA